MSSLSAQVARAHEQWLQPPDDDLYTREDIESKCEEINDLLETFAEDWCGGVEDSGQASDTIKVAEGLIETLRTLQSELEEIEENQDPRQEGYL